MSWLDRFRAAMAPQPARSLALTPFETMTFNGVTYPFPMSMYPTTTLGFKQEEIAPTYVSVASMAYRANPVVFACIEMRRAIFSQARFQWQQVRGGTPGKLFGTADLALLEHPWMGATTGDLMSRAMLDADLAGNAFIVRRSGRLTLLRPDWVTIVAASKEYPDQGLAAIDADVIGYAYYPGGYGMGDPELLLPEEVAHFAPTPDPLAKWRGWSWVNTVRQEIMSDQASTRHKLTYLENGATVNLVIKLDPAIPMEKFDAWVSKFKQGHEGAANAYKTLFLGGGADASAIGSDLKQADFKAVQGAGQTIIAAAASVPPILVGFSEGLASATYSNYSSARRRFSDGTIWPLWENMAGSLETILPPPAGARLWVDARAIPFFQEDEKDRAQIQQMDASALASLLNIGFKPDAAVDAIVAGDLSRLIGQHTGLAPVQVQPAGAQQEPSVEEEPADEEEAPARALIAQARQRLVESGVKPTNAAIAEMLERSPRTIQRWQNA